MSYRLRGIAATILHEDRTYEFTQRGGVPDDTPAEVIEALRSMDALLEDEEQMQGELLGEVGEADPALSDGGSKQSTSELPEGAPDVSTASAAELAAFIDSENLNAAQTVALAGGTPDGARKVLEAESLAQGGDSRKTVDGQLSKLAEG
ncbi:MAG: hypothetical protein LC798_15630 [Chloroflexi bacterium]|nr:hypothetical protein [Chloroflexota bacterium]